MIRLFNSFDVIIRKFLITIFFYIIMLMIRFYKIRQINLFWIMAINFLYKPLEILKAKIYPKILIIFIIRIFIIIANLNYISILSYNFPLTTQISTIFFIGGMFWLTIIITKIIRNYKRFLYHCIPEGTPIALTWFLFVIELVRNLIRPITLSIRLIANIIAGHLLISLLAKIVLGSSILFLYPFVLLNTLEFGISFIQAYIFITIIRLYYSEV